MACYAAVVSLMHTIKQIQQHPRPPISLDGKQAHSLTQTVTLLQDFLERCYPISDSSKEEEEELESRIADAAYAAEDVIESVIVNQIHAESTCHSENTRSIELQRVIEDMDLIKKEVMMAIGKQKTTVTTGIEKDNQLNRNSSVSSTGPVRSVSKVQSSTIVDFGDIFNRVMDKLTGQQYNLEIIPIVGMGGIGKTTLARSIYANPLIVEHFDILAWVTISQEHSRRGEILQVLCQGLITITESMSEDKLGETLHKHLWGRRYLMVMDDIWSIEAWDEVRSFFPDNNNGSKIIISTRLSNLAFELSGSHDFQMSFFDEDKSWNLLCKIVFGKDGCCPIELEKIGKKIVKSCRGLPLSIVVTGGLLTKSEMTREYWEYTLRNLNSFINLDNNEHCLQILHTSYKELPIHLKPCFLYMGVFPDDDEIRVRELVRLWVAEGFLKPINGRSLEEAAEVYLKELIGRNLILAHELRWNGEARLCKTHALLRDLCLREAQKQKFLCIIRQHDLNINPQGIKTKRRICIHEDDTLRKYSPQTILYLESAASLTRSLLIRGSRKPVPSLISFRLLRVCSVVNRYTSNLRDLASIDAIFQQANLRYFSCIEFITYGLPAFPSSSWSLLWNLQILKLVNIDFQNPIIVPSGIWKMPQLRHAILEGFVIPDPPCQEEYFVLKNLQTLSGIWNFECSEEVVKRIPNIKKLKLNYNRARLEKEGLPSFCLDNLGHLQNLESLSLVLDIVSSDAISDSDIFPNLTIPLYLKKLTLEGTGFHWEELRTKIGSLPFLEVLNLQNHACMGPEWETVEGQFCNLKFLLISRCPDLKYWTTDDTHFPHLERLVLRDLLFLEEIPSGIGDIPTLQLIQLNQCSKSAASSAERIKEEEEDNGNLDLKVQIDDCWYGEED